MPTNTPAAGPAERPTMRAAKPKRAVIIGGSICGLFAALLLRKAGWDVAVFERIGSELAGRGAGIVTHPELFDVIGKTGLDVTEARVGVGVSGRRVFGPDGRITGQLDLPQVLTSWGHLYRLLRSALPDDSYHHGRNLVSVEDGAERVRAHFADGTVEEADLLVGTDGLFSTVRAAFLPEAKPTYAGYVAWRGLVDESTLSPETRAALCGHFSFSLPPGEQMLGYPVAGADEQLDEGHRRYNFVWYRPAASDGQLAELLTDVDGTRHPLSIPPHLIRPEVVAGMRADAHRLLAPQFAEVVERTQQPFLQAIQDLESPRLRLSPHVVILGDAAFVARPHVGMGVTKAAADAAALAAALADSTDVEAALAAFEAKRLAFGRAVVQRARHLGAYMQAQILDEEQRARAERHRHPDAVMSETAVATGLAA